MKQTNNAMTFMQSQYRAVFKNAYLKGITVVVMGSSLSAMYTAQAAEEAGTVPTLESGNYTISTNDGAATISKEGAADFNLPNFSEGDLGKIVLNTEGTLHLQGQVNLSGASFKVTANDPANLGARISFDNIEDSLKSGSFYNVVQLTGTNTIGEQLTIHSSTKLLNGASQLNGDSGRLDVNGYLTISNGAEGSDLSAVNINIGPLATGNNAGYGDLTIDPNIVVGNLTFLSGDQSTDIDLYYDQSNGGVPDAAGHSEDRTITVASNKVVTFASGSHNIKSSLKESTGANPSLTFSGDNTASVKNDGTLNVLRPVTFTGGIAFNNTGTLKTQAGVWPTTDGEAVAEGDADSAGSAGEAVVGVEGGSEVVVGENGLNGVGDVLAAVSDLQIEKLGNITITAGSTFTNSGQVTIGSGSTFKVAADALVNGLASTKSQLSADAALENTSSLAAVDAPEGNDGSSSSASGEVKFVDLSQALGNFTNYGTVVLQGGAKSEDDYVFTTTSSQLNNLGVYLTSTAPTDQQLGKLVLDNTVLQLNESINLNSAKLSQLSGTSSQELGQQPQLQTTGRLTFTTQDSANAEALNGLALVGQQLTFQSGKTDSSDSQSILISGSADAPVIFGASQSVNSTNNKALKFENASLHLQDFALAPAAESLASTNAETNAGTNAGTNTDDGALGSNVSSGSVLSNLEFSGQDSELLITDRAWTLQDISLSNGAQLNFESNATGVNLKANNVKVDASSLVNLHGGEIAVQSFISSGTVSGTNVKLNISGNGQVTNQEFAGGKNFTLNDSTLNFNNVADTIGLTYTPGVGNNQSTFNVAEAQKVNVTNTTLQVNLDNVTKLDELSIDEANRLFGALTFEGSTGLLSITGKLTPNLPVNTGSTGEKVVDINDLTTESLHLTFDTEASRGARLTNVGPEQEITGGWKGVQTTSGNALVAAQGTLALYAPNNGQFAQDDQGNLVGVTLGQDSIFNLNGTGNIGAITSSNPLSAQGQEILNIQEGAQVTVVDKDGKNQNIEIANLKNHGQLTAADITTNVIELTANSSVTAKNLTANQSLQASQAEIHATKATLGTANLAQSTLAADEVTANSLQLTAGSLIDIAKTLSADKIALAGNSVLKATNIELKPNGELRIGTESSSSTTTNNSSSASVGSATASAAFVDSTTATNGIMLLAENGSTDSSSTGGTAGTEGTDTGNTGTGAGSDGGNTGAAGDTGSTGGNSISTQGTAHVVACNIKLNGGRLILDPDFEQATATLFANSIGSVTANSSSTDPTSNVMTIDGDIIVGRNSALGLGSNEQDFREALAAQQVNGALTEQGLGAYLYVDRAGINLNGNKLIVSAESIAKLEILANSTTSDVYLGSGAGLEVSTKALAAAKDDSVFTNMDGKTLESQGGKVIVPANITGEDFAKIFGKQINFADNSSLTVTTANGLYSATITTEDALHGNFDFNLADNSREILSSLSDPTYNYLMDALSANTRYYATAAEYEQALGSGTSPYGSNGMAVVKDSVGYRFIQDMLGANNPRALDQVGRLAALGGGMQTALLASDATTNAINTRLGFGAAQINGTVIPGNVEGNVWALPLYKNRSSDGLNASGMGYGVDANLYGAAAGFDAAFSNGIRAGAMFSLGTGDADGNGIGSGVTNDFDYYGLGAYMSATPMRNLQLTADISYTVVDNDVQTSVDSADYKKLTTSTDSQALSVGLGAQYTFKGALDIMPHSALRYTRLDMDDYDVKVDGDYLAKVKSDAMNILSIPVGVSLSKELYNGEWIIKPFADLTVTANIGNKDAWSSAAFDGVYGKQVGYGTEIMDDFTYGATFGVDAQNGNFRFGLNAGYTGSSNIDDYSVSANVRLVF